MNKRFCLFGFAFAFSLALSSCSLFGLDNNENGSSSQADQSESDYDDVSDSSSESFAEPEFEFEYHQEYLDDVEGYFIGCTNPSMLTGVLEIPSHYDGPKGYAEVIGVSIDGFNGSKITNVIFPESERFYISYGSFANCRYLTDLRLPQCITEIESLAFSGCVNLRNVLIPHAEVRDSFDSCKDVVLYFTYSLNDNSMRFDCPQVYGATDFIEEDGIRYGIRDTEYGIAATIAKYEKDDGGASIRDFVVYNGMQVPVMGIGVNAFAGMENLENIVFPSQLHYIDDRAFFQSRLPENIVLPDTVYKIGVYGFSQCSGLENITIPYNFAWFGARAFSSCHDLRKVDIGDDVQCDIVPYEDKNLVGGTHLHQDSPMLYNYTQSFDNCPLLEELAIPNKVSWIPSNTCEGDVSLRKISIFSEDVYLREEAFADLPSLEEVYCESESIFLDTRAFKGCPKLNLFHIEKGVADFYASEIFAGCVSLSSISLGTDALIASCSESAFEDTLISVFDFPGLSYFYADGHSPKLRYVYLNDETGINDLTINILDESLDSYLNDPSFFIAASMARENLGRGACIPYIHSVGEILGPAFEVDGLFYAPLVLNDGTACAYLVGGLAGKNCIVPENQVSFEDRLLPVKGIAANAFCQDQDIRYVHIPSSISYVGDYAFEGCPNIKTVSYFSKSFVNSMVFEKYPDIELDFSEEPCEVVESNGYLYVVSSDDEGTTSAYLLQSVSPTAEEVVVPSDIQTSDGTLAPVVGIMDYAFYNEPALQRIIVPSNPGSNWWSNLQGESFYPFEIGSYAFYRCENLLSFESDGKNPFWINDSCFAGCVKLQSIYLSFGCYICDYAFLGCASLNICLEGSIEGDDGYAVYWEIANSDGYPIFENVSYSEYLEDYANITA